MGGFQGGYQLDVVFVIDATGSMGPIIDQVKERALTLGDEIKQKAEECYKYVNWLRIRVIDFADFAYEGEEAIRASEFFTMPDEKEQFEKYVMSIDNDGRGGDIPENALEALWVAMRSDWSCLPGRTKGRHIIVLITDALPLDLQERIGCFGYDSYDYPESIEEMEAAWSDTSEQGKGATMIHPRNKRLVLFAPEGEIEGHSWKKVADWEHTTFIPVKSGVGLSGMSLDDVLDEIVRNI